MSASDNLGRQFNSLDEVKAAGYVTDEWQRWQQGDCGAYAHALTQAHPHLRFGTLGQSDEDGWRPTHHFAHDDTHAYDSAGKHPLPYRGIEGNHDVMELNEHASWYGEDRHPADVLEAAVAHARRNRIVQ